MIESFLYYLLPASAVLMYGIGMNRVIVLSENISDTALSAVKAFCTVICSVILCYLFIYAVLVPSHLQELYPLVCLLIFISVSVFFEVIIRITAGHSAAEFTISLLCVLLSINESCTLYEAVIISASCILSFYLVFFLVFAIRKRVSISNPSSDFSSSNLLFLSLAVIMLALSAWNVSWLNPGVCK